MSDAPITSELSPAEIESADRVRKKAGDAVNLICLMVYQECPSRSERAASQWLERAFPDCNRQQRYRYLWAGELNSACPAGWTYGLSVAAEARPLMKTDMEWLTEKHRTKREIRERKKQVLTCNAGVTSDPPIAAGCKSRENREPVEKPRQAETPRPCGKAVHIPVLRTCI